MMDSKADAKIRHREGRRRTIRSGKSLATNITDLVIAMLGLLSSVLVHFVGDFYATEIALIVLVPILVAFRGRRLLQPQYVRIFAMLGLWLAGVIITDAYRDIDIQDRMRGMSNILFFGFEIAGFAMLVENSERRKVIFQAACALSSLIVARIKPPELFQEDHWKFGYAYGTMLIVILISCYFYRRRTYVVAGLLYFGLILINLRFNFRSPILFLLVLMVLVLPIVPERIASFRLLPRKGSVARVAALVSFALGAAAISAGLVHWATVAGLAGEAAKAKNLEQEQSRTGILFGARPEIIASSRAVLDSPILGHGSWAKDMKYIEILNDFQAANGLRMDLKDVEAHEEGLIPAHSHLMGAWVQAGILGALFWGYILWLTVRGIVQLAVLHPALAPLLGWLMIGLFWDNLFSPFGSYERIFGAFTIVVIVDLLALRSLSRKNSLPVRTKWQRQGSRGSRFRGQIIGL